MLYLPLLLAALLSAAADTTPSAPPPATATRVVYPMQAALVQSLSSKSLQPGGHVLARLEKDWTDGTCSLARGSTVRGDVLRVQPWTPADHKTAVTLLFHYTCPGGDPKTATWIALMGPDDLDLAGLHDGNPVAMQSFRSSSFGGSGNAGSSGISTYVEMSGRQNPNLPTFLDPPKDAAHPRPKAVKTGEVWRVPDVSLAVGAGPDDSTVVQTKGKALHVPAGSAVILLPAAAAIVESAPVAAANVPTAPPHPAPPSFHEITACPETTCTLASALPAPSTAVHPASTLSLHGLHYNRLRQGEMRTLSSTETVTFLGPSHLLFTFDPRTLVTRDAADRPEDRPHMARAVLFNTTTGRVEHTLDWRVPDSRQYLWPVSTDRVLIHDGHRLQWLDASFKPKTAYSPEGPIAFVRLSPDRQHIAVGVIRELHSREEHAEVASVDPVGPEEQIAVHLLNSELQPVSVSYESSRALPPVLSDRGRIVLLHVGGQRWHYKLLPWGETSHLAGENIAYITSACLPDLSNAGGDLLLVTGCESRSVDRWYRVLRPDGSLVLRGTLHPEDLAPLSAAEGSAQSFAIALPAGGPGFSRNSTLRAEDISSELIRVYNARNGNATFAVRVETPAPVERPMALDPAGDRLAVLDGDSVRIYTAAASPQAGVARR